jgi:hypothetical protein
VDRRLLPAKRITAQNTSLTLNLSVGDYYALNVSASCPDGIPEILASRESTAKEPGSPGGLARNAQ